MKSATMHGLSRQDFVVAGALLVIGLITRVPLAGADEGWYDELFSLFVADHPLRGVIARALIDQSNPPGYYLLAHVWAALGDGSLAWQRLLTAVAGALTSSVVYATARRLGMPMLAGALAGGVVLGSPMLWHMSLEARPYATLALLSAVSLWGGSIIATTTTPPRNAHRVVFFVAIVHVLMVMLHYFGAFSVLSLTLAVVVSKWRPGAGATARTFRMLVVLGVPAALAVAAWLVAVYLNARGVLLPNVGWMQKVEFVQALRTFPRILLGTFGSNWGRGLSNAILMLATFVVMWNSQSPARDRDALHWTPAARARFVLTAAVVPPVVVLALLALDIRSFWADRYMTGMIPALALLLACALSAFRPSAMRVGAVVMLAWAGLSGTLAFQNRIPKPDWTTILAHLAPQGEATICTATSYVAFPLIYHVNRSQMEGARVVSLRACAPKRGPTWLVYDVEPTGVISPPILRGAVLGPRIVLFRGQQNLDARRIVGRLD